MKLICQNTGSYNRKTKTEVGEFIGETRVQLNPDARNYIIHDDEKYEIGSGSRDVQSRSQNATHLICTKYDILRHSNNHDVLNLMTTLPAKYYLNKEYREHYKSLLKRGISAEINGRTKSVDIYDTEIYMEGAAAYLVYKKVLKDYIVGLIDIGGDTINGMVFANGKLQKETITTLDLGTIKIEREIIDTLNTKFSGWNVQDYELKNIFQDDELKGIVGSICNRYVDELRKRLLEKKWNLERSLIFATGGGSNLLEPYIKQNFKKVIISENGVFDNVRGLWIAGQVIYNATNNY